MTTFERVDYDDPRAVALRQSMDEEMSLRYEMRTLDPQQLAKINLALHVETSSIAATVLGTSDGGTPVAHAALRPHGEDEWEVKRVIVDSATRGQGVGQALMLELEDIARAAGVHRLVLQTGDRQPEAVRLYLRLGYTPIPVFEPYLSAVPQSLCYAKDLD